LTRSGDVTYFQDLPAGNFEPGEEYGIWFRPQHGTAERVMVSLSFSTDNLVYFRVTPEGHSGTQSARALEQDSDKLISSARILYQLYD